MPEPGEIRTQADDARRGKQYQLAIQKYSELLELTFKDDSVFDNQLSLDFIHYAECLISSANPDDPNDDSLEIAWESLENVRVGIEKQPKEEQNIVRLIDVFELLGEISMKNGNFEESAEHYNRAATLALEKGDLAWRIPLNSLYMHAIVLQYASKINESSAALDKAIDFLNEEIAKEANSADIEDMNGIKQELIGRKNLIK